MITYALHTITSYCDNKKIYADRGELLTVLDSVTYGNIWIVEGKYGIFSRHKDNFSENRPEEEEIIKEIKLQLTLF